MSIFQKILLVFLFFITLSIGYYFVIHLPDIEQQKIDIDMKRYDNEQQQKKEEELDKEIEKITNKNNYDTCIEQSRNNYYYNWGESCKKQGERELQNYNRCVSSYSIDMKEYCRNEWDRTKKGDTECTLYGGRGDVITERLEKNKEECKQLYLL